MGRNHQNIYINGIPWTEARIYMLNQLNNAGFNPKNPHLQGQLRDVVGILAHEATKNGGSL